MRRSSSTRSTCSTERGIDPSIVVLSGNAHLIMPWHVTIDQASERRLGSLQIGTTRRGIGPTYADKASRIGIRVQDVLDPKILREKIEVALAEKNLWLERIYEAEPFDLEEVWSQYAGFAERLAPFVGDVSLLVDEALRAGKRVLFEGAQATMLDLDHGTYPFVTSSNPIASGAATGIGIGPTRIDRVLGISKAYVTRVGAGPFPSEIVGADQERLRELGGEYGTVTGRERRCGWLDLVALRYAVRVNGMTSLALTKLDVLSAFGELPVCVRYRLRDGSETEHFPAHQSDFHHATAVWETLPAGRSRWTTQRRSTTCRRPRGRTWSSSRVTCRCRSSWSASGPRASASWRDRGRGLPECVDADHRRAVDLRPGRGRSRARGLRAARAEERPGRATLAASRRAAPKRRPRHVAIRAGPPRAPSRRQTTLRKCNFSSTGVESRPVPLGRPRPAEPERTTHGAASSPPGPAARDLPARARPPRASSRRQTT